MVDEEVLAGIRVLVAVAQADGEVHEDERVAIENALDGVDLPEGTTAEGLLAAKVDLDAELARIASDDVKARTMDAASALVYVDGVFSDEERATLERIASAFGLELEAGRAERFKRFTSAVPPANVAKEIDPAKRDAVIEAEIASAAALAGALAGTVLPIAAESCLFTNNVRLARNVGLAWGHDAPEAFWRTFASNVLGAASSWFAVTSLLKLVPGYARASGPAAAFATTWALGRATSHYFAEGERADVDALRGVFRRAKDEGRAAAKQADAAIAARGEKLASAKRELDAGLEAGEIAETDYADDLIARA